MRIPRCKRFDALNVGCVGCVSPSYTSLYYASARYIGASRAVVAGEVALAEGRARIAGEEDRELQSEESHGQLTML